MRRPNSRTAKRRGSMALELLFVAPVLIVLLFAFVEFVSIVSAEEKLCRASHAGCQVLCQGGSVHDVRSIVDANLGHGALGRHRHIEICRVVRGHHGDHLEPVEHPEHLPANTPLCVRVTCRAEKCVPNLLRHIGLSLCEEELIGHTVQCKD